MSKDNEKIKYPSVLAFARKISPSDATMYSNSWENYKNNNLTETKELKIEEKTIRGTISNHPTGIKDFSGEIKKSNIQIIDTCSLPSGHDCLKIKFTLKFIGGIINSCDSNSQDFKKECEKFINEYNEKYQFEELGKRYAVNIANARFLWRNKIGAEKIEVKVKLLFSSNNEVTNIFEKQKILTYNSINYPTKNFDIEKLNKANPQDQNNNNENSEYNNIKILSKAISKILASKEDYMIFNIECFAKVGEGQEVYPSEEFVESNNEKGKHLYSVNNYKNDKIASIHSQKIGNALRTIDTWYSEFNHSINGIGPIAIEPYGAVTHVNKAYREKNHFYDYMDKFILNNKKEENDENLENAKHYFIAVLLRGGVFSKSEKKN